MEDNADVAIFPPLIFIIPTLLASVLHFLIVPLYIFPANIEPLVIAFGLAIVLSAVFLLLWAMNTLKKHETAIHPDNTTMTIVTTGPFRFTRNPMYLAFMCIYFGLLLALNTWYMIFFFPFLIPILFYGVIAREEEYLHQKFGSEYDQYTQRVNRWL